MRRPVFSWCGGAFALDSDDQAQYWLAEFRISDAEKRAAIWLPGYQIVREAVLPEAIDNASGITYCPDSDSLFVVINNPELLLEIDRSGKLLRRIELTGFDDTEGIAYVGEGRFAITEERTQSVVLVTIDRETRLINRALQPSLTIATESRENNGFEGVAAGDQGRIYIAQERSPMKLLELDGLVSASPQIRIGLPAAIDVNRLSMSDLSGLHYDSDSGHLLVLSHESKLVAEVGLDGRLVSSLVLKAGVNGLSRDIPQAEGITLDSEGHLYIVSEPNLLFVYERERS